MRLVASFFCGLLLLGITLPLAADAAMRPAPGELVVSNQLFSNSVGGCDGAVIFSYGLLATGQKTREWSAVVVDATSCAIDVYERTDVDAPVWPGYGDIPSEGGADVQSVQTSRGWDTAHRITRPIVAQEWTMPTLPCYMDGIRANGDPEVRIDREPEGWVGSASLWIDEPCKQEVWGIFEDECELTASVCQMNPIDSALFVYLTAEQGAIRCSSEPYSTTHYRPYCKIGGGQISDDAASRLLGRVMPAADAAYPVGGG